MKQTIISRNQIAKELTILTQSLWIVREVKNDEMRYFAVDIIQGDKDDPACVHLQVDHDNRLNAHGSFWTTTDDKNIKQNVNKSVKSITMLPTKPPAQIAKDINNRLLVHYLPVWEEALKLEQFYREQRSQREATYKKLCQLIGKPYSHLRDKDTDNLEYRYRESYMDTEKLPIKSLSGFEISHQSHIKLTLSLTIEQTEALTILLKNNQL